jgi:DNA-directed RNA polymerase I, II, and III subunit RPABC2
MSDYGGDDNVEYDDLDENLDQVIEDIEEDDTEDSEIIDLKDATEEVSKKKSKLIPKEDRSTRPYLTKYEHARILGLRSRQIDMGCPIYVSVDGLIESYDIAEKELREKKIPFIIRRYLPNGSYEDWEISELIY